jgi:Tol biopolymer transport system component
MRGRWLCMGLCVGLCVAACEARLANGPGGDPPDADDDRDSTIVPPVDMVTPLGPWSAPTPIQITPVADDDPSATGDLLELYFNRTNDIFVTKRATVNDAWGTPTAVTELNTASTETTPEVSYDGLTIFIASNRAPLLGVLDIWVSTRASRAAAWGVPTRVDELSGTTREAAPASSDKLTMVFESDRNGNNDTFLAQRATATAPFGTPVPVTAVNTASSDGNPMLSADGLELYINSNRSTDNEIYVSTRANLNDPFPAPVLITELAAPTFDDADPWISEDGRTMYFTSNRDGTLRLWQSTR